MAGCLRNRSEVAQFASALGRPIAVVAAGERWPDGSLRPSIEDLLGAGAIISRLEGSRSPEAEVALAAFERSVDLIQRLEQCASGRELASRGFLSDVSLAAEVDAPRRGLFLAIQDAFWMSPAFLSGRWWLAPGRGTCYSRGMPGELTADDLLPLLVRLSPRERMRLLRLVEQASSDAGVYAAAPPKADEFSTDDEDLLAWEGEGWESFG
jgi:hypothetical protein